MMFYSHSTDSLIKSPLSSYWWWKLSVLGRMGMSELIKSIEKVNDYQVKITLTKPNAFTANLAMSFMSILSKEYGDQLSPQKARSN